MAQWAHIKQPPIPLTFCQKDDLVPATVRQQRYIYFCLGGQEVRTSYIHMVGGSESFPISGETNS